EKGPFGGLCILKGCMPSKALLRPAHVFHLMKHRLKDLGLSVDGSVKADIPAIVRMKNAMIREMAEDARKTIEATPGITLLTGSFSFTGPQAGLLGDTPVHFDKAVIATGSRVHVPAIPGLEEEWILTSDDVLEMEEIPSSTLVLGGGPVGLELGQYLSCLGSDVTLADTNQNWHPQTDPQLAREYLGTLASRGLNIHLGIRAEKFERGAGEKPFFSFHADGKNHKVPFDRVLLATGRRPDTSGLNLPAAQVQTTRHGHIQVDAFLRTSNHSIFAAGDVTGILPVLNLATFHGEMAGRNAVLPVPVNIREPVVPVAIFTDPEYARAGLTESMAQARRIPVKTGRISFSDLGKAIVYRETEGGLKIVIHAKSREILGVELFGPGASDLVHTVATAMHFHATIDQYQEILHIHPTFSEIFKYLADDMTEAI
ncbi:dihydrolipoyl dehydrogenase family protein, partial [Leptospirillum ferriphilum]|uniref:dihydrolipoyl dehydrogenase family protein n=1 Tax=Leptospirillum ferriphilum TaxID=178606 RepID=UPI0006B18E54